MATATTTQSVITLKGSTAIVTEFFGYSINSILFQRGIYPPETFQHVKKYGLGMLVTSDLGLRAYLSQVLEQLSSWLMAGHVQRLVLVIEGVESKAPLERWVFNIQQDKTVTEDGTRACLHGVVRCRCPLGLVGCQSLFGRRQHNPSGWCCPPLI